MKDVIDALDAATPRTYAPHLVEGYTDEVKAAILRAYVERKVSPARIAALLDPPISGQAVGNWLKKQGVWRG